MINLRLKLYSERTISLIIIIYYVATGICKQCQKYIATL